MPTSEAARRASHRTNESTQRHFRYPLSEEEWQDRYQLLRSQYHMEGYNEREAKAFEIFRAFDESSPKEALKLPRRVLADYAFVVDRCAAALFGGAVSIELEDGASPELLERARAVWKRSEMDAQLPRIAHNVCHGRAYIEPQRLPRDPDNLRRLDGPLDYETVLVMHEPENYTAVTDEQTRTRLTQVIIRGDYFDEVDLDDSGHVHEDAALQKYRRHLTPSQATATLNGEKIGNQSGPHGLGQVPGANLVFGATQDSEHGIGCAPSLAGAVAIADSIIAQVHAVGNRYGDPKMYGKNVDLTNSNVGLFGRKLHWSQPVPGIDTEVGYLEPTMAGVTAMLAALRQIVDDVRSTYPEFALFRAGASASGEALRIHGASFTGKIMAHRPAILRGIATALEQAVAMEIGVPHDPSAPGLTLKAGPVLPPDVEAEIKTLLEAKREGAVTPRTVVMHLQRLGIVDRDADPDEYAQEAAEAHAMSAGAFFGTTRTIGANDD